MAALLRRRGWPLKRIQAHLNEYLRADGPKSGLTNAWKGHARGAADYAKDGRAHQKAAASSIKGLIEEDLAAGRLVWRKGKIVEAAKARPARKTPARRRSRRPLAIR